MATKMLESGALSAFCESVATMLSAGIQTEEALFLLGDNMEDADFKRVCDAVYTQVASGTALSVAMAQSGAFPSHAIDTVAAGEYSGHLENVLHSLAQYYSEEDRLFSKMKSAISYPAALLALMSIILAFTIAVILPVFVDAYTSLAGDLTAGSYAFVGAASIIGWVALGITLLCTVIVLIAGSMAGTQKGRLKLVRFLERMPVTRKPLKQMAVGRFTMTLATFVAAGIDTNASMERTIDAVEHRSLKKQLAKAHEEMLDPTKAKSLSQAIYDNNIYEPVYARMLTVGARSGSTETVLSTLSRTYFEDSVLQVDGIIDNVEPTLAAFLTISVGTTLVAVMLPLIGIMAAIG